MPTIHLPVTPVDATDADTLRAIASAWHVDWRD